MRVLVTGASGFIGKLLVKELLDRGHSVVALRRSSPPPATVNAGAIEWRSCDLFSARQTERAVHGADVGVYLVHSMLPTARLTQSDFADTDLLLADNFARACAKVGIRKIVYLGGLIPRVRPLSRHLASRLEVESALAAHGAEVISLRAGLILGGEGSSFQMLSLLVKRLPIMICPAWTLTQTQPIGVKDALGYLVHAIEDTRLQAGHYEMGGPRVLSYRELMRVTAEQLSLKRRFWSIPLFTPGLSLLWVRLITGASHNLIAPLIESLRHEMVVIDPTWMQSTQRVPRRLEEDLQDALAVPAPSLRTVTGARTDALRGAREVRSIQRLPLPPGQSARIVGRSYFEWLPRFLSPLIRVKQGADGVWGFRLSGIPADLLRLEFAEDRSSEDRVLYRIRGGVLVARDCNTSARLEFREILERRHVLAAIHDFQPRLPWLVYEWTQAIFHLLVMRAFGRFLARQSAPPSRSGSVAH